MEHKILFTSESVGPGHPDKICDQISDAILDAYLKKDPNSRVAIEVMASGNKMLIAGEVLSKKKVNVKKIAIDVLQDVEQYNPNLKIYTDIKIQSPDISIGVGHDDDNIGAGDQGIMFGYATNETSNYMPLAISIAHDLVKKAFQTMKSGKFPYAKSDMKSQVTLDYSDIKNIKIDTILLSIQHEKNYIKEEFLNYINLIIIPEVLCKYHLEKPKKILINPTGIFTIGGPIGDTGLTGRKIIVDTYGGASRHGGGAFSGKDATKVDRSAAYMCRYIAKNLVAAGIAERLEIQLSYAIGVAKPMSIAVSTFKTKKYDDDCIVQCVKDLFDLTPSGIIKKLDLKRPIYKQTSYFGHFGRDDLDLPWEKLDKVVEIKKWFKNNCQDSHIN